MPISSGRQPTLAVLANGVPLAGVVAAEVETNNHFAADRFRVSVAAAANNPTLFTDSDTLLLDIRMGLNGPPLPMLTGEVDTVSVDPIRGTVELTGRDLTARLIDARTQESFQNQTSSEIAETLAARNGLSAAVTATTTPVGRYYQIEHDRITLNQFSRATTEWDLLVYLARQEGFDLFVDGTTLHFQPPSGAAVPALVITPADCVDLRLERALTLARDIVVTVKSWNSRQQNAFIQTARLTRSGKGTGGTQSAPTGGGGAGGIPNGQAQNYVVVRPNLTPADALTLAQTILAELSQHERVVAITMPGELALTARSIVALTGTGTSFDQSYFVAELSRRIDIDRGFSQRIRAKNASSASPSTIPAFVGTP